MAYKWRLLSTYESWDDPPSKDPFACPKNPGIPLQSYDLGMGLRPSSLLNWEGSGFLLRGSGYLVSG